MDNNNNINNNDNNNDINIFVDGACSGNGKAYAKAGIGIHFPEKEFLDMSERFIIKPITNQRAELYAIYVALLKISNKFKVINIYTDSQYSINCLTIWKRNWKLNNWKTAKNKSVLNLDLLQAIYKLIDDIKYSKCVVKFHHVKSHTKNTDWMSNGNRKADELAVAGINLG